MKANNSVHKDKTPAKGGRPPKKRGFKGNTPKKLDTDIPSTSLPNKINVVFHDNGQPSSSKYATNINTNVVSTTNIDDDRPIGLRNVKNDCFFNSVIQALFSLPFFSEPRQKL